MVTNLYPVYADKEVRGGTLVELSEFCAKKLRDSSSCQAFYESLKGKQLGWHQCPFGLSCRTFQFEGAFYAYTGVVATPRFDTNSERRIAKEFPALRVARKSVDSVVRFLGSVETARADAIAKSSQVLPQAFHELRKLNAAVIQIAERQINVEGESRALQSIKSAAELMKNNFDILEALANLDAMRVLPLDSTVNLFDLAFKLKRVYEGKAKERELNISVEGVRAVVRGSQKSFPIVPAVLIENAIKYAVPGTTVLVDVAAEHGSARLSVTNAAKGSIDPVRCFERGVRFSSSTEGSGFGLYIAREIVTAHGGSVRCEAGDATVTMVVTLPLKTVVDMDRRPAIVR